MQSVTIKQFIDRGVTLTLRFQLKLEDYPTNISFFKDDNQYLISARPYLVFTTTKFKDAWLYFSQFTNPCRNVGVAIKMAQEECPELLDSDFDYNINKYKKIIKEKGWCIKSTWYDLTKLTISQ